MPDTDTFARDHLPPPHLLPEFVFDLPQLRYPPRLNCITELLDRHLAAGRGERVALRDASTSWTYRQLAHEVDRIAQVLRSELGLVPGNRVLLHGINGLRLAACWLAVLKAGCIAVPTMPLLRAPELAQVIQKAQVGTALCDDALRSALEEARRFSPVLRDIILFGGDGGPGSLEALAARWPAPFAAADTAADDVCLIAFTSGTTGVPKGTLHLHRDMLAICDCFPRAVLRPGPDDIFIGTPPRAFTFGLGGLLLFPLRVGASAVLLGRQTPQGLLQAVERYRATVCFTAPTFYRQMSAHVQRSALHSLRHCVSAGEPLPADTRARWREACGLELVDGIGTTEMLHIFIAASAAEARPGATGKPVPGYRACILDEAGQPQPAGVVGRLAVKGPTGCRYLSDSRQADQVVNGWNLTGDAYEMDADGYFWPRGRLDDMIVSAGYKIAPPEVENALLGHAAVSECAVVGAPDEERGQVVKAFVVLQPGFHAGDVLVHDLQDFVKDAIAPFKYPRRIEFCAALPRSGSGKLQRARLRTDSVNTAAQAAG